jgi:hypothetical protein
VKNLWPKNQLKPEQEKNRNILLELSEDAGDAEENMDICVCLIYAGYASGSWPAQVKYRE